ncbi:uncharacterized protein [Macrobrachium rosenbergii]|uniref:uncharacterized protein n=1 Tax=Macrobrachium rosenbergii TaxID=79674 RepID=UPI0034D41646
MFKGFSHICVVIVYAFVVHVHGWELNSGDTKGGVASEFSRHSIVTPQVTHSRTKRSLESTREKDGHAHDITLGLTINDEDILVDLQLQRDLLPRDYFEKYYHNGSQYVQRPSAGDVDLCHYQGIIRGRIGSWAAVSTCSGLSGVVFDGEEVHYLERIPDTTANIESPHYLFRHSDVIPQNYSCGYSGKPHPVRDLFHDENFKRLLRYKRSSDGNSNIRGPYNANALSRYVELVLVADKSEYEKHGHKIKKIYQRCKDIANIVNALYRPLNIFIALVGVEVWKDEDQVEISSDGDKTLTNFLNYRKVRLIREHPNDNAQLLIGTQFAAGVVGKALKGPICTYQYSGGVNMDHSDTVGLVATTVAHEMGHNFGMEHDTEEECECPDKRCIMAPSSGSKSPTHWSSCSYEYLALSFERSMDYCLRNKPTSLFDSPVCGNGFVESGEQCDCGLPDYCTNPCCNASACMLYANATCATGHCCDLETCGPKPAGVQCRASVHECDLPEYCTGHSEYCPEDVFKADGHQCLAGQAFCHSGMCRTHEEQCKLLWGPTGQNSDDRCYMMNTQGSHNGNCGYNWVNDTYYKCNDGDVKCGMLHCMHLNERLEFGMESVSKVSHSFLKGNKGVIPCRVALVDMGLDMVDPGLAPNGAKCGRGKMCVDQRCMPVASLKVASCNCNGHGVCNNNGHCHCDIGFAPPDCLYPGLGGSEDSGPASNPHATNTFVVGMFIFFLGIVPAIVLVMCLVYYIRGNLKLWWETKGRPATSKLPRVDPNKRSHRPPGSLCIEVADGSRPVVSNGAGITTSPRSPTPPSSQGSKSNSPLLNGHAKSVDGASVPGKPPQLLGGFFGKHEGFTLSPLKEKSLPGSKTNGDVPPPIPPPPVPNITSSAQATHTSSSSSNSNNALAASWRGKFSQPSQTPSAGSGMKITISGPSLQGSTNPAIASHVSNSVIPSRAAPQPPNVKTEPPSSASNDIPPVTVITPTRRAPSLAARPLSVPDAATLVAQANQQIESQDHESKSHEGDKQSKVARLASFLIKKEKQGNENEDLEACRSNTLPRKAAKIKRESLMQLEISAPMQLHATELPANLVPVRAAPDPPMPSNLKPSQVKASQEEASKPSKVSWAPSVPDDKVKTPNSGDTRSNIRVMWMPPVSEKDKDTNMELQRIGSMRETPVTIRPNIPKFGSMRAPRPKSLPPTRPSEPPPRPPLPTIPGTPDSDSFYDDCLNVQGSPTLAHIDEDLSPENIYATIEEKTPEKEPALEEVTYTAQDMPDSKKEKKSIFSFLYNKPKKKTTKEKVISDEVPSEPIYTNLIESPPEGEGLGNVAKKPDESPLTSNTSSSVTSPTPDFHDSNRTSCGSSEDGGLLSEIVTELSTRDAEYVSTLSKNKKKSNKNVVKAGTEISDASDLAANKSSSNTTLAKSTSYPFGSEKNSSASKTSSSSATVSPTNIPSTSDDTSQNVTNSNSSKVKSSSSGFVPRGVFSYLGSGKSKASATTVPSTFSSISTKAAGISPPIVTSSPSTVSSKNNTVLSTSKPTERPAGQKTVSPSGPDVSKPVISQSISTVGDNDRNQRINSLKSSFLSTSAKETEPSISAPSSTATTTVGATSALSNNTTTAGSLKSTTTTSSGMPSSQRPSRPVFPPDKVVFPPDKVISSTSSEAEGSSKKNTSSKKEPVTADKEADVTSPTSGQSTARGRGASPVSKVTSPGNKTGRVLSPTRGGTPVRGTTPSRNTATTGSGRGDKSRSTTPQPGAVKKPMTIASNKTDQKTVNKAEKPANKMSEKVVPKVTEKQGPKVTNQAPEKPTVKRAPIKSSSVSVGKPTGTATSNKPSGSGVGRAGRISNSHVASLQQKFEKKETEGQEAKPLTKAPSRKSQEVKPVVAPKPK